MGGIRQFVHKPPQTISPILLKREYKRLLPDALVFLNSLDASSASYRIRQWRNFTVCFIFSFMIGLIAMMTHSMCTWFSVAPCLFPGTYAGGDEDVFNNFTRDHDDEDDRHVEVNWECLLFNDVFKRFGKRLFFPSVVSFGGIIFCSMVMAFLYVSEMRCLSPRIPESKWEAMRHSFPRTLLFAPVYGVASAILFNLFLGLTSNPSLEYLQRDDQDEKDVDIIQSWRTLLGITTSFIFGCLFYSDLENSGRLQITFPTNRIPSSEETRKALRNGLGFTRQYFSIIAYLLISCYILSRYAPINIPLRTIGTSLIKLSLWWHFLWFLSNLACDLSHITLNQELGLPIDFQYHSFYPTSVGAKRLHLADGMCLTGGDKYEAYLKHLTVYEFFRTSTIPSRTGALFTIVRPELPTGYERTVDASFFILDNFRDILQEWMKCQGVILPNSKEDAKAKVPQPSEKLNPGKSIQIGTDAVGLATPLSRQDLAEIHRRCAVRSLVRENDCQEFMGETPTDQMKRTLPTGTLLYLLCERIGARMRFFIVKLVTRLIPPPIRRLWNRSSFYLHLFWKRAKLAICFFITNWVIGPIKGLTKKDEHIRLHNILKREQFQVINWTMAGVMEATCQSILLDKNGIAQPYVKQILPAYLDLYESLSKTCEVLENDENLKLRSRGAPSCSSISASEKVKSDDLKKKKSHLWMNYDTLTLLRNSCKFSLHKLHHSFKTYYPVLEIGEECKRKVIDVIY